MQRDECVGVAIRLTDGRWKRGLRHISTTTEINQYVELWGLVREVQLIDQPDQITWRFSACGTYSSSSAYLAQFVGTFANNDWIQLWKSKVENKCKLFFWLIM
ncbi:hypothetical protein HU200_062574 [Digitaria exilis]|uniref:Reverse transcriptase zinc-binding domain-containing protein n=1 Tax=Digitaria exilis TaxID=1010633 RepID=A0A835A7G8_9POAL|nr:hypothetical protein HU200_062574 [Digitaria exilis]